ncbi:MAG: hypothetical protein JWP15_1226 [Alphaproteobacteria bacterium]|nr:hypothetical protein [Alphaproteobacteria bacterium]
MPARCPIGSFYAMRLSSEAVTCAPLGDPAWLWTLIPLNLVLVVKSTAAVIASDP